MISWKGCQTSSQLFGAGCLVGFRQGLEDGPTYGWYLRGKSPGVMPYNIRLHVRCFAPMNIPKYFPEILDSLQVGPENVGTVFDDAPAAFRQSECPTPALGRRKLAAHF